jgi:hypothetical protein
MTEIKTGRPPGRPRKFVGRFHVTVRITPQLYADIQEKADASRRSISEEVETRLERLAAQDSAMAAMGTSLDRIKEGNLEAELWRAGYTPIRDADTGKKLWAEPGYPGIERSGFIAVAGLVEGTHDEGTERATLTVAEAEEREQQALEELRRRVEEVLWRPAKLGGKVA